MPQVFQKHWTINFLTLSQARNYEGAQEGFHLPKNIFASPWKNALDVVWNYWP